jgi:tRNA G10  N-methylase Trm11
MDSKKDAVGNSGSTVCYAPFYDSGGITIYHGKFEDVLPTIQFDAVLTDPPYPSYMAEEYRYYDGILEPFRDMDCPQAIFWTPSVPFPLPWHGMHVWDKATGSNTQFELIYQRGRGTGYKVHRYMTPHNKVRANWCKDVCNEHPSQKPIQLIRRVVGELGDVTTVVDPFMGSGTTLLACKLDGRRAIGIEISERYCEIAAKRLAQGVLF